MKKTNENYTKKWILLAGLCTSVFALTYTTTSIMNALPAITKSLALSHSEAGWAINTYLLTAACAMVFAGRMGDRFTARTIYYIGNACFLIASIIVATAQYDWWLLIGRVLQGLGVAFIIPNTLSIIKLNFTDSKHERIAVGIWSGIASLGFSAGPLVAGLLVDSVGWRFTFWINIPVIIIAFLLCIFIKKAPSQSKMLKIDYAGQILLIVGIFLAAFALTESVDWGWQNAWVWGCLLSGILLLIIFYIVEQYVKEPTIHFEVFKNRIFAWSILLIFFTFFSLISILYLYNLYVQNPATLDFHPLSAGLSLLPLTISIFVLSFILPSVDNKYGFRYPTTVCFALMGIGFLGLVFVSPGVTYVGLLTPLILIGLGLGGTYPCLTGLALGKLNATQAGLAGSIVSVTMYLTATISTAINGTLYIHVVFHHLSKELNAISSSLINEASTIMGNLIANRPLHQTLNHVPKQAHAKIASAIQTAVTHGFNDTALLSAVFCFIGMGVTYCFIKNTQGNT